MRAVIVCVVLCIFFKLKWGTLWNAGAPAFPTFFKRFVCDSSKKKVGNAGAPVDESLWNLLVKSWR